MSCGIFNPYVLDGEVCNPAALEAGLVLATSHWLHIATVDPENHGVPLRLDKHLHHHIGGGTPQNPDQTSHRG